MWKLSTYDTVRYKNMKTSIISLLIAFVLCGCSKETSVVGEINGRQYINKFFGFQCEIPDGWVVEENRMLETAKDASSKMSDDNEYRHQLEGEMVDDAEQLLWMCPQNSSPGGITAIRFTSMDLSKFDPEPNAELSARSFYGTMQKDSRYSFTSPPQPVVLGSVRFFRIYARRREMGSISHQVYLNAQYDKHMLWIVLSGTTEDEKDGLYGWVESINFSEPAK